MRTSLLLLGVVLVVGVAGVIFINPFAEAWEAPDLSELEPVTWSALAAHDMPVPIALQALGKKFTSPLDISTIDIEKKAFYDNPIDACLALLKAEVTGDKNWYSALCAPEKFRDSNGAPTSEYVFDPKKTNYDFLINLQEAYKNDDGFPKVVKNSITAYMHIGDAHFVRYTSIGEFRNGTKKAFTFVKVFQEFREKAFRYAFEWHNVTDPFVAEFTGPWETDEFRNFREKSSDVLCKITVNRIFGNDNNFPLTLLFRGGSIEQLSRVSPSPKAYVYSSYVNDMRKIISLLDDLPENEDDYKNSIQRKKLFTYFEDNTIKNFFDFADNDQRKVAICPEKTKFIIDLDSSFLAFGFSPHMTHSSIYNEFICVIPTKDSFTIDYLWKKTYLKIFFQKTSIWVPLSAQIEEILEKNIDL